MHTPYLDEARSYLYWRASKIGGGGKQQLFDSSGRYVKSGASTTVGFDAVIAKHPNVQIELAEKRYADQPTWAIDAIKVAPDARGKGLATAAMRDIVARADELGVTLALTPEMIGTSGGLSNRQLRSWYQRFGFVPNRGRYPDLSYAMVREPRKR